MRIHVPETIPGIIRALVKLISLTEDEVGAFKSLALINVLLISEVGCEAGGARTRQQNGDLLCDAEKIRSLSGPVNGGSGGALSLCNL